MKITEFFIKSLAVIAVSGAVSVAFLRETLYDIGDQEQYLVNLDKAETNDNTKGFDAPVDIIDKCQKAVITGEMSEIPFLCDGIEYNCIQREKTVVFYNLNQILEYDPIYGVCIKYNYRCPIDQKVYSADELLKKAKKEVCEAFVSRIKAGIDSMEILKETEKIATFKVTVCHTENAEILISYRLDTGSCIFFDATGAVALLK